MRAEYLISLLINQPIWEDIGKMEYKSRKISEFVLDYYLQNEKTMNEFLDLRFTEELLVQPREYSFKELLLENKVDIQNKQDVKKFFIDIWSPSCCGYKDSWHSAKNKLSTKIKNELDKLEEELDDYL